MLAPRLRGAGKPRRRRPRRPRKSEQARRDVRLRRPQPFEIEPAPAVEDERTAFGVSGSGDHRTRIERRDPCFEVGEADPARPGPVAARDLVQRDAGVAVPGPRARERRRQRELRPVAAVQIRDERREVPVDVGEVALRQQNVHRLRSGGGPGEDGPGTVARPIAAARGSRRLRHVPPPRKAAVEREQALCGGPVEIHAAAHAGRRVDAAHEEIERAPDVALAVVVRKPRRKVSVQRDEVDEVLERVAAGTHRRGERLRRVVARLRAQPVRLVVHDVPALPVLDDKVDVAPQEAVERRPGPARPVRRRAGERVRIAVLDEPRGEPAAIEPLHREVELQLDQPPVRIAQAETAVSNGAACLATRGDGVPPRSCSPFRSFRRLGSPEQDRPGVLDHVARHRLPDAVDPEVRQRGDADLVETRPVRGNFRRVVQTFEDSVQAAPRDRTPRKRERGPLTRRRPVRARGVAGGVRRLLVLVMVRPVDPGFVATGRRPITDDAGTAGRRRGLGPQRGEAGQAPDAPQRTAGARARPAPGADRRTAPARGRAAAPDRARTR